MKAQIQKWGNSLALRIPKAFAEETDIENGSLVDLKIEDHHLIISPLRQVSEYRLKTLLDQIDETNLHSEIEFGEPVGRELI